MPGKIRSRAQQAYLAIHKPNVLKELAGGQPVAKGLPQYAPKPTLNATLADKLRKRRP